MSANEEETLRQTTLREQKQEVAKEKICARCFGNGGIRVKVKDGFCPSCGAAFEPIHSKI